MPDYKGFLSYKSWGNTKYGGGTGALSCWLGREFRREYSVLKHGSDVKEVNAVAEDHSEVNLMVG